MATPIEQLEAMQGLPENWDGYGGAPPRAEAIESAIRFLRESSVARTLPEPFVTPARAGGVLLAWEQGARQFEVEFCAAEDASIVYLNQDTGETGKQTVDAATTLEDYGILAKLRGEEE